MECVECAEWVGFLSKSCINLHLLIGLNELINMMYFIFRLTAISCVIDENFRKMVKNEELKTPIYGSKNISFSRALSSKYNGVFR